MNAAKAKEKTNESNAAVQLMQAVEVYLRQLPSKVQEDLYPVMGFVNTDFDRFPRVLIVSKRLKQHDNSVYQDPRKYAVVSVSLNNENSVSVSLLNLDKLPEWERQQISQLAKALDNYFSKHKQLALMLRQ
ncbi:MAG: hypothetical protein ACP5RP_00305 [Candidatus Micrarchaeia archaeon]